MVRSIKKGCGAFRASRRQPTRDFLAARSGSSVVEFALVAMPFLILTCTALEAGIHYFGQEILQSAVDDASRQIYTGQFQAANAGTTDAQTLIQNFRKLMCYPDGQTRVTTFACNEVRISIRRAGSFGEATSTDATATDPKTGASNWNPNFSSYACARANEVMIVQAVIDVPVIVPMLGALYASLPNGRRVLQAASVFQVEPFDSTAACSANG